MKKLVLLFAFVFTIGALYTTVDAKVNKSNKAETTIIADDDSTNLEKEEKKEEAKKAVKSSECSTAKSADAKCCGDKKQASSDSKECSSKKTASAEKK